MKRNKKSYRLPFLMLCCSIPAVFLPVTVLASSEAPDSSLLSPSAGTAVPVADVAINLAIPEYDGLTMSEFLAAIEASHNLDNFDGFSMIEILEPDADGAGEKTEILSDEQDYLLAVTLENGCDSFSEEITVALNGAPVEKLTTPDSPAGKGFSSNTLSLTVYVPFSQLPVLEEAPDAEMYAIWVGGDTQVTAENKEDLLGDGTASYDPATNTLTLKGYSGSSISAEQALNIELASGTSNTISVSEALDRQGIATLDTCSLFGEGDLSITVLSDCDGMASESEVNISASGKLDIIAGDDAIQAENLLNVTGNGDLILTAASDGLDSEAAIKISGTGDLVIKSLAEGLDAKGNIYLTGNGTIDITTADDGICAAEGAIFVGGSTRLTVFAQADGLCAGKAIELATDNEVAVQASACALRSLCGALILSGSGSVTAVSAGHSAVLSNNEGAAVYLNGTGSPITFTAGNGQKAIFNELDGSSTTAGDTFHTYRTIGSPADLSVTYTREAANPILPLEENSEKNELTVTAGSSNTARKATGLCQSTRTVPPLTADSGDCFGGRICLLISLLCMLGSVLYRKKPV